MGLLSGCNTIWVLSPFVLSFIPDTYWAGRLPSPSPNPRLGRLCRAYGLSSPSFLERTFKQTILTSKKNPFNVIICISFCEQAQRRRRGDIEIRYFQGDSVLKNLLNLTLYYTSSLLTFHSCATANFKLTQKLRIDGVPRRRRLFKSFGCSRFRIRR